MRLQADTVRAVVAALALTFAVGMDAAAAQTPSGFNPTASAVQEEQLLRELNRIEGRITIPDEKAALLEQPQGRDYRSFHERALPWIGGIAVLGMLIALAVFYFARGRIPLEPGRASRFQG